MTTRVLGVRAAAVLSAAPGSDEELRFRYDDLQWMGVLRSLTGLQMYQRAVRGPIDGPNVVRFLLEHDRFPRAVRALLREMRRALGELPDPSVIIDEVDTVDAMLRGSTDGGIDGAALDRAMDELQRALAQLDRRITRSLPSAGLTHPIPVMPAPSELLNHLLRDHAALIRRQSEADRVLAASGAGHLVHEMNVRPDEAGGRPWRIDPVPLDPRRRRVRPRSPTMSRRGCGCSSRCSSDLYGPRTLVRDGVVPGEALSSSRRYRVGTVGSPAPPRWLTTYAVDVIELADGSWRVVQDLTDAPTGVGYALLDRSAMLRVADELLDAEELGDVASIERVPGRAAPRADHEHDRAEPAHRAVHRRCRPRRVRRALLARPSARLHARRTPRPRRAPEPPVAAHARRARSRSTSSTGGSRTTTPTRSRSAPPAARACPGCSWPWPTAAWCSPTPTAPACSKIRRSLRTGRTRPRRWARALDAGAARRGRPLAPASPMAPVFRRGELDRRRGCRAPARRRRARRRGRDAGRQRSGAGTRRRSAAGRRRTSPRTCGCSAPAVRRR